MADSSAEDIFKAFFDQASGQYAAIYEDFLGRYLRMPQFGIGRETLGEATAAGDAYHKLAMAVAGFMAHFGAPFFSSLGTFQETVHENEDRIESAKDLYQLFMEELNRKYEVYLKSPEGVRQVAELVDHYIEFKNRLDNAMEPWLAFHSIPTKRDMREVYRKIHDLKRKNRELDNEVKKQHAAILGLTKKIEALEAAGPAPPLAKKSASGDKTKSTGQVQSAAKTTRRRKKAAASKGR